MLFLIIVIIGVIAFFIVRKVIRNMNHQSIDNTNYQTDNIELFPHRPNYQISPENQIRYTQIINSLSDEELENVSDEILNRVLIPEMAVSIVNNDSNAQPTQTLQDFYRSPIQDGPICGCQTNIEAIELSNMYQKRLKSIRGE